MFSFNLLATYDINMLFVFLLCVTIESSLCRQFSMLRVVASLNNFPLDYLLLCTQLQLVKNIMAYTKNSNPIHINVNGKTILCVVTKFPPLEQLLKIEQSSLITNRSTFQYPHNSRGIKSKLIFLYYVFPLRDLHWKMYDHSILSVIFTFKVNLRNFDKIIRIDFRTGR